MEIGQTRPFSSAEEEVLLNLLRTGGLLEHAVGEGLKPYGITPKQYNVLRILRGAGEEGLRCEEIRSRMLTPVPDVTRMLDRLSHAGLVTRDRDPQDRRAVVTRITPAGLRLLETLEEPVRQMHKQQLGHMRKKELRLLADLLTRVREPL